VQRRPHAGAGVLGQCNLQHRKLKTYYRALQGPPRPSLAEDCICTWCTATSLPVVCPLAHLALILARLPPRQPKKCAYAPPGCRIMSKFAVETSIRSMGVAQRLFQRPNAYQPRLWYLEICGRSLCPSQNATNGLMKLTAKLWQE